MPSYAKTGDGAMDLYATEDVEIAPGESKIIKTGIKCALPLGYAFLIQPRSGLSSRTHMRIPNSPGLIDSGYRGEIGVIIENNDPQLKTLHSMEMVISPLSFMVLISLLLKECVLPK